MLDLIMLAMLIGIIVGLTLKAVAEDPGCALIFAFGVAALAFLAGAAGIFLFGWWALPW